MVASVDSVVQVFNAVLNQSARNDLIASFASIKKSLTTFEKIAVNLDDLVVTQSIRFPIFWVKFNLYQQILQAIMNRFQKQ